MSVTSIGSTFSTPQPLIQTAPSLAAAERIVVAAAGSSSSDNQSNAQTSGQKFPAQLASTEQKEKLARTSLGMLLIAQEESRSKPSAAPNDAAAAYASTA